MQPYNSDPGAVQIVREPRPGSPFQACGDFPDYANCMGKTQGCQGGIDGLAAHTEYNMPFDLIESEKLGFMPMNHTRMQPIAAEARKVFDEKGEEVTGYHRIVRGDTGKTIRVCSDGYTVIQNSFAIETVETALAKSTLDCTDMRYGIDYSHDGARMFAQWMLPAHTAKVKQGVEATLRLILLNSYDGSTALHCRSGSFNWACANQSVSGKEFESFRFTHTGEIDLPAAVAKLTLAAEDHVEQAKRWELWPLIDITDEQACGVLCTLPHASDTQIDALVHAWLKARDDRDSVQSGSNLWALYNVLTAWATYDSPEGRGGRQRAQKQFDRQKRVAQVIDGKLWTELAEAA
jgi:Domain of unknown function (DUF932)